MGLAAGAAAAVGLATLIQALIRHAGAFTVLPVSEGFTPLRTLPSNLLVAIQSVLILYGADPSGAHHGQEAGSPLVHIASVTTAVSAIIHLVGVAAAAWATARALRRFRHQELLIQVLAVAAVVLLAAYTFSGSPSVGGGSHEIAGILPIGAVLAGRLLATPAIRGRHLVALSVLLASYAAMAVHNCAGPPADNQQPQRVIAWLAASHLRYGLANYWTANSMTVISGDRILVRAVGTSQGTMVIRPWESQASWYDAGQHSARFFILSELSSACPPAARHQWLVSLTATFGPPAATRQFPGFRVLIWHHNLLGNLTAVAHGRPQGC